MNSVFSSRREWFGNIQLNWLTEAEGLILPQTVVGDLDLRSLTSAEGLTLQQTFKGTIYLPDKPFVRDIPLPYGVQVKLI